MRIELNDKATDKVLKASGQSDRSAAELANLVLESLQEIEIVEIVSMKFRTPSGTIRTIKHSRRWITDYK